MAASTRCVIGVGSPHGDDQAGWLIADALDAQQIEGVTIRKAASPSDILNWSGEVEWLGICDACRGVGAIGDWHCWTWPDRQISQHHFSGTHGMSLSAALSLAATLGQVPQMIKIWGIEIGNCLPGEPVSIAIRDRVPQIVDSILREVRRDGGIHHA